MSYGFRITVVLAPGHCLSHDEPECEIPLPDPIGTVLLKGLGSETISTATQLAFSGSGYENEDLARTAGGTLKNALRLAAIANHVPLDVGDDTFRSGAGPSVKQRAAEDGVQLLDHVHGLQVYEETGTQMEVMFSASPTLVSKFDNLFESVRTHVPFADALGPTEQLACDLLALSGFETSDRARHLTASIAGEVLSDRAHRTGVAARVVDEVLVQVDGALAAARIRAGGQEEIEELRSLRGALTSARRRSHSSAFRSLADEIVDGEADDARDVLSRSYRARSDLVHTGKTEHDLPPLTAELVRVLGQVILARASHGDVVSEDR